MFEVGARVRTRAQRRGGHTRLPGYLQRKSGVVARVLGAFALSDERAAGAGIARNDSVYTVVFMARDLWGPQVAAGDTIAADLFEAYLEPD